jgi:hypothetical protein
MKVSDRSFRQNSYRIIVIVAISCLIILTLGLLEFHSLWSFHIHNPEEETAPGYALDKAFLLKNCSYLFLP